VVTHAPAGERNILSISSFKYLLRPRRVVTASARGVMIHYLLCDKCRAPSTQILWPGHPYKEQALCTRCYEAAVRPVGETEWLPTA
jgi:hypothetical protein